MHHSGLALIGKAEMALMGKVQVRFARVPNELRRDVLSSLSLASDFRPRMRSDSDSANADRLADTVLALALGRPGGEAQSLASSRRTAAGFAWPARAGGVASAGRAGTASDRGPEQEGSRRRLFSRASLEPLSGWGRRFPLSRHLQRGERDGPISHATPRRDHERGDGSQAAGWLACLGT